MHKHLTHNTCYASYREFAEAPYTRPRRGQNSFDDNFRVIDPKDFQVLT